MAIIKLIPAFILALFSFSSNAQTHAEIIKKIRQDFRIINADTSLKTITLENDEFLDNPADGGSSLTGYFKNDVLVKLVEWIGFSNGNRIREYYFSEENLFFVYERFESFVQKGDELDKSKTRTSFQGRYYITHNKLIDQKLSGEKTLQDKPETILKDLLTAAEENKLKLKIKY